MRNLCTIDQCQGYVHGRGMCTKHYLRWYAHGDAGYTRPAITACRVSDCARQPRSRSVDLCETHYYRLRRNGTLELKNLRRTDAKYRSVHSRIARDRGKASAYPCVDCGRTACHWSYEHSDPDARVSDTGQPYSLDPKHYAPRCAQCHAIFDGTGANQYSH